MMYKITMCRMFCDIYCGRPKGAVHHEAAGFKPFAASNRITTCSFVVNAGEVGMSLELLEFVLHPSRFIS